MGRIHSEGDGRIRTITIESEGKRNAVDFEMVEALAETYERAFDAALGIEFEEPGLVDRIRS